MPTPRITLLMAVSALAAAPLEARDSTTVRPQDFGAVGDGMHNDTTAVREAFAKCAALGGCDLIIDDGVFLTGPVRVSSGNTRLIFGGNGTLLAAPRDQWIGAGWAAEAVLTASLVQNIAIQGPGKIDGNGAAWWAAVHDDLSYRPHMMALRNITDLTVDGVALLNSPNHNVFLHDCTAVRVTGLAVSAPHDSPNTDGINFCGGSDQSIVDSHISNGDDCVSIVTSEDHKGEMGYGGGVIVSNVTCVYGHGISIGSIKHGTVTNVTVTNVTFISSENGARIKTYPNNTGLVADITYSNIVLVNASIAILIDGKYCPKSQKPYPCPPGDVAIEIRNITFEGFRGTVKPNQGCVGLFDCSELLPCRDITMRDIHLEMASGSPSTDDHFACKSAVQGPPANDVTPPSCLSPLL